MAVRVNELERAYFTRKSGGASPLVPFNQVKRDYIAGFLGNLGKSTKMPEAERLWLTKLVAAAGQTPAQDIGDLWKQAVIAVGVAPVKQQNENKIRFYLNAP